MSLFSCEEKKYVMEYVLQNYSENNIVMNEAYWKELSLKMNRDWSEIRDAYYQWAIEADVNSNLDHKDHQHNNFDVCLSPKIYQDLNIKSTINEEAMAPEEEAVQPYEEAVQPYGEAVQPYEEAVQPNEDVLYFIPDDDGQMVNVNDFEPCEVQQFEVVDNVNCNGQNMVLTRKRKVEVIDDFNYRLLKKYEENSNYELEMKRQEHEKKMKLLKMQLEQREEIHKEKLKILKTKLGALQESISVIDHAIFNKSLKKKFKSGPI